MMRIGTIGGAALALAALLGACTSGGAALEVPDFTISAYQGGGRHRRRGDDLSRSA